MAINDRNTKSMPIPNYKPASNKYVEDEFKSVGKPLARMNSDRYTVEREVAGVERTVPNINRGIQQVSIQSAWVEPRVPDLFPQTADYIKSLDFSVNDLSAGGKTALADYYNLCLQLMNNSISVPQYYAKMPSIMEAIKGVVLTETDWEDLRDAILRTQNYILNYLWTDMQNISKAMDTGFSKYQKNINDWIDEANRWYNSTDYLPKDTVKLENLSNTNNGTDRHQLAQNMTDVMSGMITRMSKDKPALKYQANGAPSDVKDFPANKQLVWIELI